jgi:hypothetical protein
MWQLMWNKLLYVYTNSYGTQGTRTGKYYHDGSYEWLDITTGGYFVIAACIAIVLSIVICACWDAIADAYWRFVNRHKIKSLTIKINGNAMSPHKLDKLTDDVNVILAGKKLPEILSAHNLSATDIVGMSAVPQHDCFLFTVWYK